MSPAAIMSGATNSCVGVWKASSCARHSSLAISAVPSAATNTTKIVPTYTGSEPRWVRLVVRTERRAMPRSAPLYASAAVNGSSRLTGRQPRVAQKTRTPSAIDASEIHSAGLEAVPERADARGAREAVTPGVAAGAWSA